MDKWCFNVQTTSTERLRKALLSCKISLITKLELYWMLLAIRSDELNKQHFIR